MASQTITADFTSSILVPDTNDVLVVGKGVTGVVNSIAIDARSIANDRFFSIGGDITALGGATCMTIGTEAFGGGLENVVNIRKTGALRSETGTALFVNAELVEVTNRGLLEGAIGFEGVIDDGSFLNKGTVLANEFCIELDGDSMEITNDGLLKTIGETAVSLTGGSNILTNSGTIRALGEGPAVELNSVDGDVRPSVDIFGKLVSGGVAISANRGMNVEIASGALVKGDIVLGNAASTFTLSGKLEGIIHAGSGSCFFTFSGVQPPEIVDGGGDYAMSSDLDTRLPDFFAVLSLIGDRNIKGVGNDLDNIITGNPHDNVLRGRGGNDLLVGGDGDDRYFLGEGADTILSSPDRGNNTVMDFVPGTDIFDVAGKVEDFAELQSQLFNVKGGVEFREGEDILFFKGLKKADLGEDSFDFVV